MKVLLTGFDPFGNEKVNPSFEAVKLVNLENEDIQLFKKELPTVFNKSIAVLEETIKEINPDIVICTGQAGGRFDITIERIGINIDDARIPDNEDNQPIDEKIFKDGENAYFSTLPIKSIVKELRDNHIPASVSNTAGTFVCNHILYGTMYLINKKFPNIKGGFVHVPFIPEQVIDKKNAPSMSLDVIANALRIIVEIASTTEEDIVYQSGRIC